MRGLKLLLLLAALAAPQLASALVFCSEGSPAGFDPALYTTSTVFDASAETLFNRLVEFKKGRTELQPGLAEFWNVSEDGKVYTFHLRRGVAFHSTTYFHPSRPLEAADVVFTFERMLDKSLPFNKAFPATFPYFDSMGMREDIVGVRAVDAQTVEFRLRHRNAPFLQNLAMSFASIQSAEYAAALLARGAATELDTRPIGTGPFQFVGYEKDRSITYKAFGGYWNRGEIKIDSLVFLIESDPDQRLDAIRAGKCDVSAFLRPQDVDALARQKAQQVVSQVGSNLGYIAYNVERQPLNNVLFRKALDAALDKPALVQAVYGGKARVADNGLPPTQWGYVPRAERPAAGIAQSKALLEKSGVKAGTTIVLWQLPVQRAYNPNPSIMAQMIKADWAKIGIRTEIRSFEWAEYNRRASLGQQQAMLIGWTGDNGDPDNWLGTLFTCDGIGGNNDTRWCNKRYTALIGNAKSTVSSTERLALYAEAQDILMRELPFSPIANAEIYQSVKTTVHGFVVSPFGLNSFRDVSIDEAKSGLYAGLPHHKWVFGDVSGR